VVSNIHCVVFLFYFSSLPVSLDCLFLIAPSVFSKVLMILLNSISTKIISILIGSSNDYIYIIPAYYSLGLIQ